MITMVQLAKQNWNMKLVEQFLMLKEERQNTKWITPGTKDQLRELEAEMLTTLRHADYSEAENSSDIVVTHGGKWVWSEANNKWEWEEAASASTDGGSSVVETEDAGSTESPWTLLPNGTYIKKSSSWSSWSSSSSSNGGAAQGGAIGSDG